MIELINIFNSIADSNLAYYLLVIILLVVVMSMIYLIYSQNKEINEARKIREKELIESVSSDDNKDMVDELASEIKNEKEELELKEEKMYHTTDNRIRDSILNNIQLDKEDKEEKQEEKEEVQEEVEKKHNIIIEKKEEPSLFEPVILEEDEDYLSLAKVEEVENVELTDNKKMELIDATLTNIPKISLLEETMTSIPAMLDYSNETEELLNITKELEKIPKERTIKLTPYEEEQEQTAIISYDELVNKDGIVYDDSREEDGLSIKKVDLDHTPEVKEEKDISLPRENYAHEELFLNRLKSLQNKIN